MNVFIVHPCPLYQLPMHSIISLRAAVNIANTQPFLNKTKPVEVVVFCVVFFFPLTEVMNFPLHISCLFGAPQMFEGNWLVACRLA